jgi:hypothetical protein
MKQAGSVLIVMCLLMALLACSTTDGALREEAAERDRREAEFGTRDARVYREEESFFNVLDTEEEDAGLRIRSQPAGADVYLNNRYMGFTPLKIDDIEPGRYKVTLRLEGYYSESEWITYSGDYESLYFDLEEITGFLQIKTFPPEAEINYGSQWVPAGRLHELAVGPRTVRVRAFGYEEQRLSVEISERRVTELSVTLKEAPFSISDLQSNRNVFNPRNAGLLGSARIRFRVSTVGTGRTVIRDQKDQTVFSQELGRFLTWQQGFDWDGRDQEGVPLPDGSYTVRVEGDGARQGERDTAEIVLRIDSSIVLRFRSLWSGSAGLLYVPSPDILPGRSVQLSSMVMAHGSGNGSDANIRVPVNVGMRVGLSRANRFELNTSTGGIIGYRDEAFYLPWFASAAFKASLLRPSERIDIGSAAQVKFTYQSGNTDTLANFTGFSLGLPTSLNLGPLAVLFSPEAILSWEAVSYTDTAPPSAAYGWLYSRFGVLLDYPSLSVGASVSLRSLRFDEGLGLDSPFQTAVEAHWLIPNTQLFLSVSVAGEVTPWDSIDVFGGVGLGILN